MPLGASRLAYLAKIAAGGGIQPGGGDEVSGLDDDFASSALQNLCYAGTNSSGQPVFLAMWPDLTATTGQDNYQLFSVATDGTVTKGTIGHIDQTKRLYPRFITECDMNSAGYLDTNQETYGLVTYVDQVAGQWYARAFSIDQDNLTLTFGTAVTQNYATWDITYVGNGKYVVVARGGNNDRYVQTATVERTSGLSITHNNEWASVGDGGGFFPLVTIGYPDDKWFNSAVLNNQDGHGYSAVREYNNTFYKSGDLLTNEWLSGDELNCLGPRVCKGNTTDIVVAVLPNITGGNVGTYLRAAQITWNTGTTVPTVSLGNLLQVHATAYSTIEILPDANNSNFGKIFVQTAGGLYWKNYTLNGTTISADASWTQSPETVNAYSNIPLLGSVATDTVNSYYSLGYRDSTNNDYTVYTLVESTDWEPTLRTDAYADYLELCVPFNGPTNESIHDLAHYLNSSNSVPSAVASGTNPASSTEKYWAGYTHSYLFTQGDNALRYTLNNSIPSAASGTFVIEGWFKATASGTQWCLSSEDSGGRWIVSINNETSAFTTAEGNQNFVRIGTDWTHVALVCDGGTKRLYQNGIYKGAWLSGNTGGFSTLSVGQFKNGDANDYDGYIQDLRVYVGTNKGYTGTNSSSANFTLPSSIIE